MKYVTLKDLVNYIAKQKACYKTYPISILVCPDLWIELNIMVSDGVPNKNYKGEDILMGVPIFVDYDLTNEFLVNYKEKF